MIILGLSGALGHDPSAALLVDGEVVVGFDRARLERLLGTETGLRD